MSVPSEQSTGRALFVVSDASKRRLTVNIPQNDVPAAVKLNTSVQITVPEHPGKVYNGVVRVIDSARPAAVR